MADTAAGEGVARWKTHRPLQENVLESVEEEIRVAPSIGPQSSSSAASPPLDGSSQVWWSRLREQVAQQVEEKPARTALLALGAGALTAWLLGRTLRRPNGRE